MLEADTWHSLRYHFKSFLFIILHSSFFFLKVFIEFVTIPLLFYVFWFFGHEACGILAPHQGSNPHPLHW